MNIYSIFNKSNYDYLQLLFRPFVKYSQKADFNKYKIEKISDLIRLLEIDQYDKIVVVAAGPSASLMKKEENTLYMATNRSYHLMKNSPYIYIVNDPLYLLRYLKSFNMGPKWKGTIFWNFHTSALEKDKVHRQLLDYLYSRQRNKPELLISNRETQIAYGQLHQSFNKFLKEELEFVFYGVNSGFVLLVIGYILAYHSNKELDIYGLDLGEKGSRYFDGPTKLGRAVFNDKAKQITKDFLEKICSNQEVSVRNHSYFFGNQ